MPDLPDLPNLPDTLTRRSFSGILLGLAGASALAACAPAPASPGAAAPVAATVPATVPAARLAGLTLKVGDQKAGLQALLAAAGLDQGLPYAIEWSTFTSGPPLLEAAAAGAVDVGGVGNTPPIFAGAAGSPIAAVSASQDRAEGDAVLVPASSTLTSFAQLAGKKIAVAKGSSAHGHLVLRLQQANLSPTDVQIAFVAPSDGYAALAAGRVDAWVVWDPYTAQAQQELGARILVDGHGVANGLSFLMASRAALQDPARNTAIGDLVVRKAKALQWARAHPEQWAKVYAAETGLPYAVALVNAQRSDDDPVGLTDAVVASEQKLVDALAAAKVIPATFAVADIVDHRFDAAVAQAIRTGTSTSSATSSATKG